jgi:hypothetical protein
MTTGFAPRGPSTIGSIASTRGIVLYCPHRVLLTLLARHAASSV